jgi:SpoVK/Ycf46/Vps4 family AAA+-type ATPase
MRPRFLGTRRYARIVGGSGSTQRYRAAKGRARSSGKDIYRIDLSSVISKHIGQTERNIRRLLDAAQRANAVLYFDEADNVFERPPEEGAKRASAAKNYLLTAARRRQMTLITGRQAEFSRSVKSHSGDA